jgi:hypothetical protein
MFVNNHWAQVLDFIKIISVTSISGEKTESQSVTIGEDITFTGWLVYVGSLLTVV